MEGNRHQEEHVLKVAEDWDNRFSEVEQKVKSLLWSRFAEPELAPLARKAEKAMDRAELFDVKDQSIGFCETQNYYLKESIKRTNRGLASWKAWIPMAHYSDLMERMASLTD